MKNGRFSKHVAIVTGGASGIGEATTRLFSAEGARVFVVDIDATRGNALADELESVIFLPLDVGESANCNAMVKSAGDFFKKFSTIFFFASRLIAMISKPCDLYFLCISFIHGNDLRQGPHQVAQKSR